MPHSGNFCPESNTGFPTAFSHTRNPQVDSTEKKIAQDNCHLPYFELSEHSCECTYKVIQKLKANNIRTFLTRRNSKGNHFQLSSQEHHLEPIKLGKILYVPIL